MREWINDMVGKTLRCEIRDGGVTPIGKQHTTGWRVLPGMVIVCLKPGRASVSFEGGVTQWIASGEAVVIPAAVTHTLTQYLSHGISRWLVINFYIFSKFDLFRLVGVPVVLDRSRGEAMGAAIENWVSRREEYQAKSVLLACVKEMELGMQILGILAETAKFKDDAYVQLERIQPLLPVIAHLNTHYAEPVYRDTLAQLAHMSTAKFHRVFQEATGETPMNYLSGIRLRQAQQSLIGTGQSVATIAREVGYPDLFTFSKRFKRACGMSPLAYRQATRHFMSPPKG